MLSTSKSKVTVGVDFEAGSLAAAEVAVNGSVELRRSGVAALPPGVVRDGEVSDPSALTAALRELWAEHKLSKAVRVGVANNKLVVRTLRMPLIESDKELETAIRFQAQEQIPMPLEEAVIDWQVIAKGLDGGKKMDVVVVAARREMISSLLSVLRGAGLKPIGIDVAAFGLIRALGEGLVGPTSSSEAPTEPLAGAGEVEAPGDAVAEGAATLVCSLGDITNLAVAHGRHCLFTRVSSFGVEGIAQRLAERRQLTLPHAREWIRHVGLAEPLEAIEGDDEIIAATREALADGAAKLADELRLSIDYYGALEGARAVEGIVVCGTGTVIPGLADRLQRDLGYDVRVERPRELLGVGEELAARLTTSFGLALEE